MQNQDFAFRIKSNRMRLGISQEELAGLSGLSLRTVQRIESGQTEPRGDSLKRLAQALQIDIKDLTEIKLTQLPAQVNADPRLAILLALSAFTALIHPLLGLLLPLILYILYRNTNVHVKTFGKKIVWVECFTWLLITIISGYLLVAKMYHFPVPQLIPFKMLVFGCVALYALHFLTIAVLLISFVRNNKPWKTDALVKEVLQ